MNNTVEQYVHELFREVVRAEAQTVDRQYMGVRVAELATVVDLILDSLVWAIIRRYAHAQPAPARN